MKMHVEKYMTTGHNSEQNGSTWMTTNDDDLSMRAHRDPTHPWPCFSRTSFGVSARCARSPIVTPVDRHFSKSLSTSIPAIQRGNLKGVVNEHDQYPVVDNGRRCSRLIFDYSMILPHCFAAPSFWMRCNLWISVGLTFVLPMLTLLYPKELLTA